MKRSDKQKYNMEELHKGIYEETEFYDEQESDYHRNSEVKSKRNTFIIAACLIFSVAAGVAMGAAVSKKGDGLPRNKAVINVTAEPKDTVNNTGTEESPANTAITPASQENDLINIIAEARKKGMTKHAYLTFDDGPSRNVTGEILDILKTYNVKATFFEVGRLIRENPDITKRVHDEGHLIANHSYSHNYNALYATEESFAEEITNTEKAIEEVTGEKLPIKLIRFPGGSYNAGDHAAEKQIYKKTLANMGYYFCDWNTLNGDAEGSEKNSYQLVEFFKSNAASFVEQDKNLIVLMHDSDVKQETVHSLESIILYLRDKGYTFHRLDDIK
ncbi:MAG: polysaccharide deacetylase family protein [bacterium]|nr:polysaccharide deacetylase family protein [bacterium]